MLTLTLFNSVVAFIVLWMIVIVFSSLNYTVNFKYCAQIQSKLHQLHVVPNKKNKR